MEVSILFNKVINLPYDQEFAIGGPDLWKLAEELRSMHEWENQKQPPHPGFKPEYLDKINAYYGSASPFLLVPFLKYMFTPPPHTHE